MKEHDTTAIEWVAARKHEEKIERRQHLVEVLYSNSNFVFMNAKMLNTLINDLEEYTNNKELAKPSSTRPEKILLVTLVIERTLRASSDSLCVLNAQDIINEARDLEDIVNLEFK